MSTRTHPREQLLRAFHDEQSREFKEKYQTSLRPKPRRFQPDVCLALCGAGLALVLLWVGIIETIGRVVEGLG